MTEHEEYDKQQVEKLIRADQRIRELEAALERLLEADPPSDLSRGHDWQAARADAREVLGGSEFSPRQIVEWKNRRPERRNPL